MGQGTCRQASAFSGYVSETDHYGNTLADLFSGQAASSVRCDETVRDKVDFVLGRSKLIRDRLIDVLCAVSNFEQPEQAQEHSGDRMSSVVDALHLSAPVSLKLDTARSCPRLPRYGSS